MLLVKLIAALLSLGLVVALPADAGRASSVTTVSFWDPSKPGMSVLKYFNIFQGYHRERTRL